MYLIDTNIFLEILLSQQNKEICKNFLNNNIGKLYVSDFSCHSIGVILIKAKKQEVFSKFFNETIINLEIITLPSFEFNKLVEASLKFNLDFDDAYQYSLSELFNLEIVTMDKDFKRIESEKIIFI